MSKVKDENYYQISGWMINKLNIKGTTLNVYAIIYGFTQDGESEFQGSRQYLCDFTGATKPTIDKSLNELVEKGLILKQITKINNVVFNKYKANLNMINNFTTDKETLLGSKETLLGGSKETLPNNNILDNIEDNKKERKTTSEYDTIIDLRVKDKQVKTTIYEFIKMRKLIKKPMTNRALELMIGKLQRIADNPQTAVEILEQSIMNNWQDIYELKNKKKASYGDDYNGEYDV